MNRLIEIIAASLILLLLLPFLLPVILILLVTGENKVFYLSTRVAKNQKLFSMIKFATMITESPKMGTGEITMRNDPRVFPFGRFLRRLRLDEIPQLLNVIKGDMTFVGPRPLPPVHFNYYTREQQQLISQMKPGITGIGSVVLSDELTIFESTNLPPEECYQKIVSPFKASLEKWYFENKSAALNFKILLCTGGVVITKNSNLPYKMFKKLPVMNIKKWKCNPI